MKTILDVVADPIGDVVSPIASNAGTIIAVVVGLVVVAAIVAAAIIISKKKKK